MRKMFSKNKLYKYYVAWCCKEFEMGVGFGNLIMHSTRPLLLESENDLIGLKNYVSQAIYEQTGNEPEGITIMDWRPIK